MKGTAPNPTLVSEEALFAAALERPGAERPFFLDGACHGNPALRQRLEALIAAHEGTGGILRSDTVDPEMESSIVATEAQGPPPGNSGGPGKAGPTAP